MIPALVAALLLAVVHVYGVRLTFSPSIPRSHWLSLAGGASVALVFVHILPELGRGQQTIDDSGRAIVDLVNLHIYLIALLGLVAFYGLERTVRVHYEGEGIEHHIFWVHIGAFAVYNAIIGYLLTHRYSPGMLDLFAFTLAMMLHFVINDHALREEHRQAYHKVGRWLLAVAVITGWGIGQVIELGDEAVAVLFAFVAGALVLNVLKEELPSERESRFWAFALGALLYSALLVMVD